MFGIWGWILRLAPMFPLFQSVYLLSWTLPFEGVILWVSSLSLNAVWESWDMIAMIEQMQGTQRKCFDKKWNCMPIQMCCFLCVAGELLHLIHHLLPPECCNLTPALPNLLSHASNASLPSVQHQALAAVAILSHLHAMLKRRPAPASLFLDRTLQGGGWGREESKAGKRSKLYTVLLIVYWNSLVSHSCACRVILWIAQ